MTNFGFAAESYQDFVVRGIARHEQFGSHPSKKTYIFVARSQGCIWSVSVVEQGPDPVCDEVLAVGNSDGVFITMDMQSKVKASRRQGNTVGANSAQAIVTSNAVPNCSFVPCLGPIWLTYLSGCALKQTGQTYSGELPPPVSLNAAGGSTIPLFETYKQKSFWRLAENGLPSEFASVDEDGHVKGIMHDQLVRTKPYVAPFDKGFTNIIFKVLEFDSNTSHPLPKIASLDVLWLRDAQIARIHRFEIEAQQFELAPRSPVSEPTTRGISVVSDGRLRTQNAPIVLEYLATNRFLNPSELAKLPQYAEAVKRSLGLKTPSIVNPTRTQAVVRFLAILTIISSFFLILFFIRKTKSA